MNPRGGQKATMLCEMPGGVFRPRTVTISAEGLLDHKNRRFHDNHEDCVFPVSKPYRLKKFDDLKADTLPFVTSAGIATKWMLIGEENGYFPYSAHTIATWKDVEDRQHRRLELQDVGRQNAELRNIHHALGNPLLTTYAVMGAIIVTVMVIIIAAALVLYRFSSEDAPPATAALLALLGMVTAAPPVPLSLPRVVIRSRSKNPLWSVYLYDLDTRRKSHWSLPFSEIAANVTEDAWRYPILGQWKWWGLAVGVMSVGILGGVMYAEAPYYLLFEIVGGIFLLPIAAILGFLLGPALAPELSWLNRPYVKLYRGRWRVPEESLPPGEEGDEPQIRWQIVLSPVLHTHLTGVQPYLWTELVEENLQEQIRRAVEAKLDTLPEYDPVVNRADDAWEDRWGLLEREDTRIPMTFQQQLQIGSIVVMAAGSVITAFFVVMATTG